MRLEAYRNLTSRTNADVSTVTKIEAAIERLPSDELRALVNWIEDYAAAIGASETRFGMYDARRSRALPRAKRGEISASLQKYAPSWF
jgi:hypothetical protein